MSGLPSSVPGSTVSRFCASGLNAIAIAARMIEGGSYDVAIAGGLESITMLQNDHNRKNLQNPWLLDHKKDIYMPMGQTAEVVAERYGVTRDRQDEFALASQQRTAAAQRAAKFADEILPMTVTMQVTDKVTGATSTKEATVERDECNRPDTTLEGLAKLPPAFREGGTVTAGNASQLSDGASVALLMSAERANALGVRPLGIFRGFTVAACEPDEMGIGPVFAVPKLLRQVGIPLEDIDLVELNEAFASQAVYCRDRLGIDPERLNHNGGAIDHFVQHARGIELHERDLDPRLVARVEAVRGLERQEPAGLDLGGGVRDPVLDRLLLGEHAPEDLARERAVAHEVEGALHLPEPSHHVMDAAGTKPLLRDTEAVSGLAERVRDRHADVREPHLAVGVVAAAAVTEGRDRPHDLKARRV